MARKEPTPTPTAGSGTYGVGEVTDEGVTVDVTGGVAVVVTGVGVGVGVVVGEGRGVGVGRGRGVRSGETVTLVGPGTGVDPGLAAFGGDVAPDPDTGTTSVFTVALNGCPEESAGPAALLVEPAGAVFRGEARSLRLPCWTWRPTASTCDEPTGEVDGEAGSSETIGLAVPEDGPESTIICGGPGGFQALPKPR